MADDLKWWVKYNELKEPYEETIPRCIKEQLAYNKDMKQRSIEDYDDEDAWYFGAKMNRLAELEEYVKVHGYACLRE